MNEFTTEIPANSSKPDYLAKMIDKLSAIPSSMIWFSSGSIITIFLIIAWKFMRSYCEGGQFTKHVRINGKVVIITGCNTGIGYVTALEMARSGGTIYMACRDHNKCEVARKKIIEETGNVNVFNRHLDLASFASIRKFASDFLAEETRLDILINNAGVMVCPKTYTTDGFEYQIGVNHLGHFLLTHLLLEMLKRSAPSRIVVVSSITHAILAWIKKEDLNSDKSYNRYLAYSQSKLANILFTRHLALKLKGTGVTVNALHPGCIMTELPRHIPLFLIWLTRPVTLLILKSVVSGAQTTLCVALDPDLINVTGKYFKDCKEHTVASAAEDDEMAEWLWNTSEEITGLKAMRVMIRQF